MNNIINESDPTNIYKTLQPTTAEYTFFLNVHGVCSSVDHMLSHSTSLNTFTRFKSHKVLSKTTVEGTRNQYRKKTRGKKKPKYIKIK